MVHMRTSPPGSAPSLNASSGNAIGPDIAFSSRDRAIGGSSMLVDAAQISLQPFPIKRASSSIFCGVVCPFRLCSVNYTQQSVFNSMNPCSRSIVFHSLHRPFPTSFTHNVCHCTHNSLFFLPWSRFPENV